MTLAQLSILAGEDNAANDPKKRKRHADMGTAADLMMFAKLGNPGG